MKIQKTGMLFGVAATIALVCCLSGGANASAATITWKGGTSGSEYDWNVATNWDTNKVPTINDDVILDKDKTNSATNQQGQVMYQYTLPKITSDVAVKSIKSVNYGGDYASLQLDSKAAKKEYNFQVAESVTGIEFNGVAGKINVIPTGKVYFDTVMFDYDVTLNLNGQSVTLDRFVFGGVFEGKTSKITGNGVLTLKDSDVVNTGSYNLNSIRGNGNDYTGTTVLDNVFVSAYFLNAFGMSDVTMNNAQIQWDLFLGDAKDNVSAVDGKAIDNKFTIAGQMNFHALNFSVGNGGAIPTVKMPNIELDSNISMLANNMRLDITGIKANNHCIEYWSENGINDNPAEWFIGGPIMCAVDNGNVDVNGGGLPGAPAAGIDWIKKNPIVVTGIGLVVAAIVFMATKVSTAKRSK